MVRLIVTAPPSAKTLSTTHDLILFAVKALGAALILRGMSPETAAQKAAEEYEQIRAVLVDGAETTEVRARMVATAVQMAGGSVRLEGQHGAE